MPGLEFVSILILGALVWLWLDSLTAREAAVNAARAASLMPAGRFRA